MPKAKQSKPSLHNQDLTSRLDIQKVLPSHSSSYQGCIQKVQMYRQHQNIIIAERRPLLTNQMKNSLEIRLVLF